MGPRGVPRAGENGATGPGQPRPPESGLGSRPPARPGPRPDTRTGPGRDARFGPRPDARFGPRPDARFGPRPDARFGPRARPAGPPGAGPDSRADPRTEGRPRHGAEPGASLPQPLSAPEAPWDTLERGTEGQTATLRAGPESALRAGSAAAPVREPGTGPQRGRRGLPDQGDRQVGGDRAPGRAAAPPREFGQPDEDESDVVRVRRTGGGGRSASRKPRGRSGAADQPVRRGRPGRSAAKTGRRRLLLWVWTGVAAVVVAAAAVGVTAFLLRAHGLSHTLAVPSKLGSYVRRPSLERQMNAKQLQQQVIAKSAGQASHVVSAVYENSDGVSGKAPPQIILFIGGNLTGVSPSGFITSFTSQFKGAQSTSAGTLGGKAACVNAQNSATGSVALCTWADSDTFGVVASQTMGTSQLAAQMLIIRPGVEHSAK